MKKIVTILFIFSFMCSQVSVIDSSAATERTIRVVLDGVERSFSQSPVIVNQSTLVPMRSIFELLGATVEWEPSSKTVRATKGDIRVTLSINAKQVDINEKTVKLTQPAQIINDTTMVPLRFVSEALGGYVAWDGTTRTVTIESKAYTRHADKSSITAPVMNQKKITLHSKTFQVRTVEIPSGALPKIGLAQSKFGHTSPLITIAEAYSASIAINGTYFEAYGGIPDPWGTLIDDGQVLHIGSVGSVLGFTAEGKADLETISIKIEGAINGSYQWPNNWYAYNFNRTPAENGNAVILFTPAKGNQTGIDYGTSVVVADGVVTEIVKDQDVRIPSDGYVIHFTGSESKLAERFNQGDTVAYRTKFTRKQDGAELDWADILVAIGAGPRLVKDGVIAVDPVSEGFQDPKILTARAARSGIGVKADGNILLATVPAATIQEWAEIFLSLGARHALNLDGGASSGLYFQGETLTAPGRELSNVLWFE